MSLDEESKNFQLYTQQMKNKHQEYVDCGKEKDWIECWGQIMARFDLLPKEQKREADLIFQNIVEHGLAKLGMIFTPLKEQRVYVRALAEAEAHLVYLERQRQEEVTRAISGAIERWRDQSY